MEYLQQKFSLLGHFSSSIKAKLLPMKRMLKGVKKNIKEKGGDVSCIFLKCIKQLCGNYIFLVFSGLNL